jgi:Fic family protein
MAPGEPYKAFIPAPLPPQPGIELSSELLQLSSDAALALGRLDGVSGILPEMSIFLYFYIRKEALLSAQIEGTQSSLYELLLFEENPGNKAPSEDIIEVSNYIAAINYGIERLQSFPLSLRFIRELHGKMLASGRGSITEPGEFRRSQNWIGGTRPGNAVYVPPPASELLNCMGDLELFIQSDHDSVLIKAALIHAQFESIHPFLDGNGRIGRLLITLFLMASGATTQPVLYLSLYLKANRARYYELLQEVRVHGDWEAWIMFFLRGVQEVAMSGISTASRLLEIAREDAEILKQQGRRSGSLLRLHAALQRFPLTSARQLCQETLLSLPAVNNSLDVLSGLKIITEQSGQLRNRMFRYDRYIETISEGTEPL